MATKKGTKATATTEEAPVEAPVEEAPEPAPAPAPKKASKASKTLPDPEDLSLSVDEFIRAAYMATVGSEPEPAAWRHHRKALTLHGRSRQSLLDDLTKV